MGIGSVTSDMLLRLRADTTQAQREFGKLTKSQKQASQAAVDASRRQASAIKTSTEAIKKMAVGVGVAAGAFAALNAAATAYAERQQLVAAAAGANIDSIQTAALGLLNRTEALTFAAAAQNTEFKLNQKQMETVAAAMVSLRRQGNNFAEVQRRVTQAVVEGNARALRPFGVIVEGSTGKVETHTKVLEALRIEADKLAGQTEVAGESFTRMQVRIADWKDTVVQSLGEVTAKAFEALAALEDALSGLLGVSDVEIRFETLKLQTKRAQQAADRAERDASADIDRQLDIAIARNALLQRIAAGEIEGNAALAGLRGGVERLSDLAARAGARFGEELEKAAKPTGKKIAEAMSDVKLLTVEDVFAKRLQTPRIEGPLGAISGEQRARPDGTFTLEQLASGLEPPPGPSPISKTNVELEEFIRQSEGASIAFNTLSGAATSAFTAWATGSVSAAEAFKMFIRQVLEGLAATMAAKAAEELALGVAASILTPAVAGKHYAAAALFAGGAVLAGGLARQFGGGGGATPPTRSSVPAGAQGIGAGGGPTSSAQTLIFVSNPFDDNPREARRRLSKAMQRARDERGGSGTAVVRG